MKLHVEIKPTSYIAPTKKQLRSKIMAANNSYGYTVGIDGTGMTNSRGHFIMINYEKRRNKRGVYKAHWIAYVYIFPTALLGAMRLKVIQGTRTFRIEPVK